MDKSTPDNHPSFSAFMESLTIGSVTVGSLNMNTNNVNLNSKKTNIKTTGKTTIHATGETVFKTQKNHIHLPPTEDGFTGLTKPHRATLHKSVDKFVRLKMVDNPNATYKKLEGEIWTRAFNAPKRPSGIDIGNLDGHIGL